MCGVRRTSRPDRATGHILQNGWQNWLFCSDGMCGILWFVPTSAGLTCQTSFQYSGYSRKKKKTIFWQYNPGVLKNVILNPWFALWCFSCHSKMIVTSAAMTKRMAVMPVLILLSFTSATWANAPCSCVEKNGICWKALIVFFFFLWCWHLAVLRFARSTPGFAPSQLEAEIWLECHEPE